MPTSRPFSRTFAGATVAGLCLGVLLLSLSGCADAFEEASGSGGGSSELAQPDSGEAMDSARQVPESAQRSTSDYQAESAGQTTQIRERAIIRTGSMTIRTKHPTDAADRARSLLSGGEGYVGNIHSTSDRKGRTTDVELVLRVPVDDYDRVVGEVKTLGKLLDDHHEATDVTKELTDVESRISNQQASIERLRTLMSRAETVGQVVQVESELTTREADLESLQSQYALLSEQTSLSTLTARFQLPPEKPEPPKKEDERGFFAGLGAGWDALGTTTQFVLTAIGALLPFLVVLAVLAAVPFWYWRRLRASRA